MRRRLWIPRSVFLGPRRQRGFVRVRDAATALQVAAKVYYNDGGTQQIVDVVSGTTTITVKQYTKIFIDCTGTRSNQSDGSDALQGFISIGYRVHWGENIETTWAYPEGFNLSVDEETGSGSFAHVFRTTGTKTVRIRGRDSADQEGTISFTVTVEPLDTPVTASPSGAWGTISSGATIGLTYGADYSAKSGLNLNGLDDVTFIATGDPEDGFPTMGTVRFDSRIDVNGPVTRSSNIRLVNVDTAQISWEGVGASFCGALGGRVRTIAPPPTGYYYAQAIINDRGPIIAGNHKHARGLFFHDTGELVELDDSNYCFIGGGAMISFMGVDMHRRRNITGNSPEHVIRPYIPWMVYKFCRARADLELVSYFKGSADGCAYSEQPDTLDRDFDVVGDYDLDREIYETWFATYGTEVIYGYARPAHNCVVEQSQFGTAGSVLPVVNVGYAPQNGDPQNAWPPSLVDHSKEAVETISIRNNVWYHSDYPGASQIRCAGRYIASANNRIDMGNGALLEFDHNIGKSRVPVGFDGPYYTTDVPVPTPF